MSKLENEIFLRSGRFNPLDPAAIGAILRDRLEQQDLQSFPPKKFPGSGIYSLYYVGDQVSEYEQLVYSREEGLNIPIYVGKAEAGNSSYGYEPDYSASKLHSRIVKHANSVGEVEGRMGNIAISDFRVRYLPLEDAWIVLGERALLRAYRPVLWNTIVSGFGANASGVARKNPRSVWDTVHPGRGRAGRMPHRLFTLDEMRVRIRQGIEISLMQDGLKRGEALARLRNDRPLVIWAPAKSRDVDKRIKVSDERRFLAEIERIGIERPEYRRVSPGDIPFIDESEMNS